MRCSICSSRSVSTSPKSGSSALETTRSRSVSSARASGFQRRRPRNRRRSVTGSVPPMGPSSRSRHCSTVSGVYSDCNPSSSEATMRCSLSTTSVGFRATGTPACNSARRKGSIIPDERTMTAISRNATSSSRCARRSASATAASCAVGVCASATETSGSRLVCPKSITVCSRSPSVAKNSGLAPRNW